MKAIMISIQPQWVEKILNGEKTIEIRKTMPKCELPCKVYIYCTKAKLPKQDKDCVRYDHLTKPNPYRIKKEYILGANYDECLNGKVVAEFTLDKVNEFHIPYEAKYLYDALNSKNENILKQSCLSIGEILTYLKDKYYGYAWYIDNLKIYDKPKHLQELFKLCDGCEKLNTSRCANEISDCRAKTLKRPPQSWFYCQGDDKK